MRSITVSDSSFVTLPAWARYVVRFCLDHRVDPHGGNAMQVFGARSHAERWARATMRSLPKTYDCNGAPRVWALVYATPINGVPSISNSQCYLAIDNGGQVAKRHAIAPGYLGHVPATDAAQKPSGSILAHPYGGDLRPTSTPALDAFARRIAATGHHLGRRVGIGNGRYGEIARMGSWAEGVCVLIDGTTHGYTWTHYEDAIPA
jgi:hypothetical protein